MNRLLIILLLAPAAVGHASPSPSDSLHSCLLFEPGQAPPVAHAAGKRLADLKAGEPRTVRMFYFLPNDRPYRAQVVQRIGEEMLRTQAWLGEQMEAHGYGYRTIRLETDDQGEPVVHRVDGRRPDDHYVGRTWSAVDETGGSFDLSRTIAVVVVDNSTNRIDRTLLGAATWSGRESGVALVGGDFSWETLAHELAHSFGMGHDFRNDSHILSYGLSRNSLSACSARVLAVHPYFNPDVGVERGQGPAVELLSATTYPAGAESVPIRLKLSDPDGLYLVRVRVPKREAPRYSAGGWELKTCRSLTGEKEAVVEIDYDGVIPSGSTWGLWDLSDPQVHPISLSVLDTRGDREGIGFDLWEVSRQHLATLDVGEEVHGVAFAAGGARLASGSGGGVRLWEVKTRRARAAPLAGGVTAVAVSADGSTLASGTGSGQVQLLDLEGGRVTATLSGPVSPVRSLAFSADGSVLASGEPDGIHLWDLATRTRTATLSAGAASLAFSPDGATLASSYGDAIRLWNVETLTEGATYRHGAGSRAGINTVSFSPDGSLVASGGDDNTVRIRDVTTGEGAVLGEHDRPVRSVAFSPDGTLLASGADLAVNLWALETRERLATLQGEGRDVRTVAFAPDGTRLAAGTKDGRIGLWDVSEWRQPRPGRLVMVSGGGQQGTIGEPLADPLVVEVRDQYGDPMPGVEILFTVVRGDGTVGRRFTVERASSGADGRAEAVLTLGPDPGTNSVEVSAAGLEVAVFNATGIGESARPPVEGDFSTWHLPDAAKIRVGKGRIGTGDGVVAFSPDGKLLAVGTYVGVWLYDMATSREMALLPGRRIFNMAFSSDGRTLVSCGAYKDPIRLWDVATGNQIAVIDHEALAVDLSPDGKILASGSSFGIELWDVETGVQRAALSVAEGVRGVETLDFSPDGRTLAAGLLWDHVVQLWDVATTTRIASLKGHRDRVASVSFSPDGRTVASGSNDHTVRLWDVASRSSVATLEGHEAWVWSVAFSPDGRTVASGSGDGSIKLWNLATGEAATLGTPGLRWVQSVAFSPDGRTVASGSSDDEIKLWDLAAGSASTIGRQHHSMARSVALSPDGTALAVTMADEVQLFDAAKGTRTATLRGHASRVNSVSFSPDGATLASAASDQTVRLWDVATGAGIAVLEGNHRWINAVAFSPDGRRIASGHGGGTARIWDVATGANTITLEGGHSGIVGSLVFSPDGATLASVSAELVLWNLATATPILTQKGVQGISFAPDGTALAVGWDGYALATSVWMVPAGGDAATLSYRYGEGAFVPAFSPDGSFLVAENLEWNVSVLEVREAGTGRLIASLEGHGENLVDIAFSRDGSTFASSSQDGTVLVWDLRRVLPHPRVLGKLSGDGQEGPPGAALADPLMVEVRDQHGDPLEGAEVTFALTAGVGTLSVETAATDARGRAATVLTLGRQAGPNGVEASVGGLPPVTFTALGVEAPLPTPDFDDDGLIGFADFFLFAEAVGGSDPRFDLDGSGRVDLADFFLFVEDFGPQERAKLVAMARELIGLPEGPLLQQNAPNPFNSQTVISWFLAEPGPARLEVFALTGQRVAVLHQGPGEAGLHRLRWDGRDDQGRPLGSGVYVYRLVTSGGAQTRKLTLLR